MKKKTRYIHYFFTLFTSIFPFFSYAQHSIHQFKEALYITLPQNYGREAIYTDEFLWNYYNGTVAEPKAGQNIVGKPAAEQSTWITLIADTSGFFRPNPGTGGNLRSPNNPAGPGRLERVTASTNQRTNFQRRGIRTGYLYTTYYSDKSQYAVLNVKGNSAVLINGELHAGDPYRMGWLNIPIQLKKGTNKFYIRGMFVSAQLHFPVKPVYIQTEDMTLPDVVLQKEKEQLVAGMVIVNSTGKTLKDLQVESTTDGKAAVTAVPTIPPYSSRKIPVMINASRINQVGEVTTHVSLSRKNKILDEQQISLRSMEANKPYRVTFISEIDGSVQYYAVHPAIGGEKPNDALFFSVHGAGVEAIGQAQAYKAKDWGTLVAPTNRRPRGFNWEDWGRLDALEVLALAKEKLQPDSQRIYLTGHSMGGHGTWFLGATYPEKWAAIAPCAGYPTLKGYGSADGIVPENGQNEMENTLLRASNQSDVIAYASNYKPLGVYVLHGDADRTVPVHHARQMREVLGQFHPNFNYYEYPGGSHWYGDESVDWKPLFDYFKWHKRPVDTAVHSIDFKTANPNISSSYYWASIIQQQKPLAYSHIAIDRDVENLQVIGKTDNVELLQLDLRIFPIGQTIKITLDSLNEIHYAHQDDQPTIYLQKKDNSWQLVEHPPKDDKGPHRNGIFKEAFNHRMVYVYGTNGNKEENKWALAKARYDAESWYYRGNGSFDIIPDHEFQADQYTHQNIILIGNEKTNSAWSDLLKDCPIRVDASGVLVGDTYYEGDDLGGYFTWKKPASDTHTVGVITGTGIKGMQATTANQYFAGASGFPDYMFFRFDMLESGSDGLVDVGFYNNQWKIK
ncbi:prolyl oligopeptidase family serine peptidase [Sphingobacterium sp. DN00404]|uniref:Prolyl oligopeptidase family serine peptidase n=1 Tax=Sphingobacterium micropteri TaxID=2763501 RepID=A0ABR7YRN1_9SPHI|nr:prolyl oligopeptidase family serine peptidase [Sphingobacterium micropteri]MBD1433987.1 prolyl oligopeptidase family serine peptidase [Sphingobacterium micropteri]